MSFLDKIFKKKEDTQESAAADEHLVSDSAGQEDYGDVAPVMDLKYEESE